MIRRLALLISFLAVLGPASTVVAGISVGSPSVDPEPNVNVVAGVPVKFLVTGSFEPPDESGSPWITFVWNFGDGTAPVSQRFDGAGAHTHELTHTFAQGGIYDVTVTGGHGFDFFGFRFSKTKKMKVKVECAGSAPSPKKCAKGTFSPFKGAWVPVPNSALSNAILELEHLDNKVVGALSYQGQAGDVTIPIIGKMKHKVGDPLVGPDAEVLTVKFKSEPTIGRLVMPIGNLPIAYRDVFVELVNAPATLQTGASNFAVEMLLAQRNSETDARLCTTVGAGKKKAKPGDLLFFGVGVQNEGVASLPSGRTLLSVQVTGGTIEQALVDRAETDDGQGPSGRLISVGPLGAGKGQKNAQAEAFVGVRVAQGAKEVAIDVHATDNPTLPDEFGTVKPPPDRRICVPVVE